MLVVNTCYTTTASTERLENIINKLFCNGFVVVPYFALNSNSWSLANHCKSALNLFAISAHIYA